VRPPHIPHIPPASPPVLAIRSRCLALHRPEARGQLLVDSHEPARVGQAAVERGGASERVVVAMHPSGSERFDPAPGLRGGGTGERGMKRRGRVSGLGGGADQSKPVSLWVSRVREGLSLLLLTSSGVSAARK